MPSTRTTDRIRPRKRPSQARSQRTVDAILKAAAQVFSRRGYAATTTNHIAERAGVSIGSLYEYFPSKDALLAALMEAHIEEADAALSQAAAEDLGIRRSWLRNPASRWITRIHNLAPTSAQAAVEFTSPTTTIQSGLGSRQTLSYAIMTPPVCSACVPLPTPRSKSGKGIERSRKNAADIFES